MKIIISNPFLIELLQDVELESLRNFNIVILIVDIFVSDVCKVPD